MKLYFAPGACSLSPHIVLREADLPFELRKVDLASKKTQDNEDFLRINPKGQVPALELDDGSLMTEVPAIVQYLADRAPSARLAPAAGTMERYRLQEWLNFIASELHKSLGALFRPNLPGAWEATIKETVAGKLDYLNGHLAGNDYLLDDHFSVADSYAFAIINWADLFKIDIAAYPSVQAYMDRIYARPHVREALQSEGLIDEVVSTTAASNG